MAYAISHLRLRMLFRHGSHALLQSRKITADVIRHKALENRARHKRPAAAAVMARQYDRASDSAQSSLLYKLNDCARQRDAAGALELLRQVDHPNLDLHNTVLNICAKACEFELGWELWSAMPEKNVSSYNAMISLCGSALDMQRADDVWEEMLQADIQPNLVSYTAMIRTCGLCGEVDKALKTFNSMKSVCNPEAFVFAAAMAVCARVGDYPRARELFVEMTEAGIRPTHHHFNSMITACVHQCGSNTANAVFEMMPAYGLKPRVEDYTALIACCRFDVERCRQLLEEMRAKHLRPSKFTYEKLIWVEMEYGSQEHARTLISEAQANCKHLTPRILRYADRLGTS